MFKQGLVAALIVGTSVGAWADVTINSPEDVVMIAIDDQEIRGGLFRGNDNSYKLDEGQHSISVRYHQIFNHDSGEHDVLKSNIVTLNQVNLQDGQRYTLQWVDAPSDFDLAKKYVQSPTIALKDSSGKIIAQQEGATSTAKPWFSNGIFSTVMDLRTNKKTENSTQQPAVAASAQSVVNVNSTSTSNANLSRDQQLIQLWQSATTQERQKFTAWLAEQATK